VKDFAKPQSAGEAELQNLFHLMAGIWEDTEVCAKRLEETDSQFWRRTYVRTLFALIEGVTYRFKRAALACFEDRMNRSPNSKVRYPIQLSDADNAMLREQIFDLDDKGQSYSQTKFIPLSKNLRFAFASLARAYEVNFAFDLNSAEWSSFQQALAIRNRLAHPKASTDLFVSDEELLNAKNTFNWFRLGLERLFTDCMNSCYLDIEEARQIIREEQQRKASTGDVEQIVGREPRKRKPNDEP